jgi:hypothetical protein
LHASSGSSAEHLPIRGTITGSAGSPGSTNVFRK